MPASLKQGSMKHVRDQKNPVSHSNRVISRKNDANGPTITSPCPGGRLRDEARDAKHLQFRDAREREIQGEADWAKKSTVAKERNMGGIRVTTAKKAEIESSVEEKGKRIVRWGETSGKDLENPKELGRREEGCNKGVEENFHSRQGSIEGLSKQGKQGANNEL